VKILIVEDRETTRLMVAETLRRRGHEVVTAATLDEGRNALDEHRPDSVLTDLQLPDGSGLDLLARALAADARRPVIVMSAFGTIQIAVDAIKTGAYDFVTKPFDSNRLVSLVEKALERRPRATSSDDGGIVAESPAMRETIDAARKVAPSDATVLLLGESGTGKEVLARAIHAWSGRSRGPMISVNCAAVPRELLETEFFGAERGAYTGAVVRKIGKVELASGGTFFLDEIAELHGELQAKLLRVLQERTFTRVGGVAEIHADIRVVAATNQDIARAVEKGTFREDLYYRLNVFPIRLPPLRERPEDVAPLARKFLATLAEQQGCPPFELPAATQSFLSRVPWPGNVRQLRNAIERATILAGRGELEPGHFGSVDGAVGDPGPSEGMTLLEVGRLAQRRAESEAIRRALRETAGNRTEAARRLGVSYKTLWAKLKEYEIR
jgi:two-component system response regulator FlrC